MLRKLNLVVRTRVRTHTTKTPNSVTDIFSSVVPNSGSTARDHLANERTFLAWARTGLTFVGLGVAIDSLLRVGRQFCYKTNELLIISNVTIGHTN